MKTVRQKHQASAELLALLKEFRRMVNVCIAVGIEANASSFKTLSLKSYHRLDRKMLSYYRLCAISTATGILHNYRKAEKNNALAKIPCARKLMLTTCYGFKIQNGLLRLPVRPRQYVYVKLSNHTVQVLSRLNARSVTLTSNSLCITYSKETIEIEPKGYVGVDRNLDNVTVESTDGTVRAFDLSEATKIKADYRYVKSRFRRNDSRTMARVFSKYGERQRNRVQPLIHNVSKRIVDDAKTKRNGIVLEKLSGLRKLYRRGNFQSRNYRVRMNSWSYGELQRQIDYKAQ